MELLATITQKLDEANAPTAGRWVVVSPAVAKLLTLELTDKLKDNSEIVQAGYIGSLYGLGVYKSNNTKNVLFGVTDHFTLAEQFENVEKIRMEKTFADCVRGLHLYGAKITAPACFGSVIVSVS